MTTEPVTVVCHREYGDPVEVATVEQWALSPPDAGQVRVRTLATAINPADINMLEGRYGTLPPLPCVPGGDGVGIVEALGDGATGVAVGDHVIAPDRLGFWCEAFNADATQLLSIPKEIPADQAAMLTVNPPTAYRMLHDFVDLQVGDWVIQNAGNSGVGRAVIALCKANGWHTVSVVRRQEVADELRAADGDVVLLDEKGYSKKIEVLTGASRPKLGLNAVGGDSCREVARCLAPGGTLVTYGAMGKQPITVDNGLVIFKDIRLRGFWRKGWTAAAAPHEIASMFDALAPLAASGHLQVPVAATYSLSQAKEAIAHAVTSKCNGKILFTA